MGFSGSKGTPFLLQVMCAARARSAALPVRPFGPQVHEHQVVVGAARHDGVAAGHDRVG
jgi:hypothetical protein